MARCVPSECGPQTVAPRPLDQLIESKADLVVRDGILRAESYTAEVQTQLPDRDIKSLRKRKYVIRHWPETLLQPQLLECCTLRERRPHGAAMRAWRGRRDPGLAACSAQFAHAPPAQT